MEFHYEFGPGFEHGYNYVPPVAEAISPLGEGLLVMMGAVLVLVILMAIAATAAVYVLQALSLQTMAKRRGIANAWLAWVPVGSSWLLGAIADDINLRQGKKTSYAIVLLVVTAACMGAGFSLFLIPFLGLFSGLFSIAVLVVYYIALYEIYRDYTPRNAVLYLVLSILLGIHWLLLFLLRQKRPLSLGGNPDGPAPRPAQPPQAAAQPPVQQRPQPPVGWSPDLNREPHSAQPDPCPKEHWAGIMQPEEFWPEPHIEEEPESRDK